uniref:Uncharacterized protein n=1 Tax=Acrobeloides nanus TaxID=290746 RepID=A0A914BUZ0_9BILA
MGQHQQQNNISNSMNQSAVDCQRQLSFDDASLELQQNGNSTKETSSSVSVMRSVILVFLVEKLHFIMRSHDYG